MGLLNKLFAKEDKEEDLVVATLVKVQLLDLVVINQEVIILAKTITDLVVHGELNNKKAVNYSMYLICNLCIVSHCLIHTALSREQLKDEDFLELLRSYFVVHVFNSVPFSSNDKEVFKSIFSYLYTKQGVMTDKEIDIEFLISISLQLSDEKKTLSENELSVLYMSICSIGRMYFFKEVLRDFSMALTKCRRHYRGSIDEYDFNSEQLNSKISMLLPSLYPID